MTFTALNNRLTNNWVQSTC